jgi:DNA-binding transcriptional ArsR family regulator
MQHLLTLNNHQNLVAIDILKSRKLSLLLKAIQHQLRQQMLQLIDKKEIVSVTEIYTTLQIDQAIASQNLAVLRKAKLIEFKKQGKQILYSINYNNFIALNSIIEQMN